MSIKTEISTDPTVCAREITFSPPLGVFCWSFCPLSRDPALSLRDPPRSRRDSAYSLRDLVEIRGNLVQFSLISSRSDQISVDLAQSQPNMVVSGENLTWFRNFQLRPRTDRYPRKSDHPNRFRSPVGGGSRNERPELIGAVPGWAQTQPRPTRGQA